MTNTLVGDVYAKIIQDVVNASHGDFEEHGISSTTLNELQQEWQAKLSRRGAAQMPWDPKPAPPQPAQPAPSMPSAVGNGLPPPNYGYDAQQNGGSRVKTESAQENVYQQNSQNGYAQPPPTQGGEYRARQLMQEYSANQGANNMQARGLALPGQPVQRPQGLQLPGQAPQQAHPQYTPQQQQQIMQQRVAMQQQQQQQQYQQGQPRIKVENDSPQPNQGTFQQQRPQNPAYAQTDGADDGMVEWQAMLAQRRAAHAEHGQQADRMMRDQVMQLSADLQSGLMLPLNDQPNRGLQKRRYAPRSTNQTLPQLDGELEEDEKPEIKDEDDENAINSDLDDPDDEGAGAVGDDDDDMGDSILCTYDKVQRVKNKWKCTLKDGIMSVNGKEYVFHKGTGEFEW